MNELSDHAKLSRFIDEGRSWGEDRLAENDQSRRVAWWVAGAASAVAIVQAIAIAAMLPLKTVVPQTILVDRQTGHVTTVDPTRSAEIAPDSALTRSMLAQYVLAREAADRATVRQDYRKVMLWSAGPARKSYLAMMAPDSSSNPLIGLAQGATIRGEVRSVTQLEPGLAMVRFDRIVEGASGSQALPYVATLRFGFRDKRLAESDRFINPLGFEVTTYRRDAETVPVAATPVPEIAPGPVQVRRIGEGDGQ